MAKSTVLSVDDDENFQTVVRLYLESEGYDVQTMSNGRQLLDSIDNVKADVVLLDLVMPGQDGLSVLAGIRSKTRMPIIVVSGKADTTEKIVGLEMGADDYITKPFEMRELVARIKAVMRRAGDSRDQVQTANDDAPESIPFNEWILDRARFQLTRKSDNSTVDLTIGEYQLLEALVLSANRALSRERLFELTRDSDYESYDRAIDIQVARLRKKLGDDNSIKTVRGVGYMLVTNP